MLLQLFARTLLFYLLLLVAVRLMGRHSLSQLSPFDFVVAVMLADAAVLAIENTELPVSAGLVPIATLVGAELALAWITLKSPRLRSWIIGTPVVVVRDGNVVETGLRRLRYSVSDLLTQLRAQGVDNLADVEMAVWEPSGEVSVVLRPERRPLQPGDIGLVPPGRGMAVNVVQDGLVNREGLRRLGLGEEWLRRRLRTAGIDDPGEVLLATVDPEGRLFVQRHGGRMRRVRSGRPRR